MDLFTAQKNYFASFAPYDINFRIRQLKTLYQIILSYEERIYKALEADLGKGRSEAYQTEIGMVLSEIKYAAKNLKRWCKPKRLLGSLINFPSLGLRVPQPKGVVLIISPWNYPFQLALSPMVSAIAAGNCVVVKPSEFAPQTAALLTQMIGEAFEERYCRCVEGDLIVTQNLLALPFDHIFFTGSSRVGKAVMEAAAQNLTPVTLELGGKSPCILHDSGNLKQAAKRIAWGKLLNAGQTCVAPDYLLVHSLMKKPFVDAFMGAVRELYGTAPIENPAYPRIVNETHFQRITGMLEGADIAFGGEYDPLSLKIAPTLLLTPDMDSPLMQEEIFGPLLPVLEYQNVVDAVNIIAQRPRPLACYIFSEDGYIQKRFSTELSFGGGCINDTIMHLTDPRLPFGGIGNSGMGASHGKAGFDTFTHYKSILKKSTLVDIPLRYPPYTEEKDGFIKRILK